MKRMKKWILILTGIALLLVGVLIVFQFYLRITSPNVNIEGGSTFDLYVQSGSDFPMLCDRLFSAGIIEDTASFLWVAKKKHLNEKVHAGRYIIHNGMSNNALVNKLRAGAQDPVRVTFHSVMSLDELAERIAGQIEPSEKSLAGFIKDPSIQDSLGFNRDNFLCMFIPNTYEFFWNTSPSGFVTRMKREYDSFWNRERLAKAAQAGLSPSEVCVLASIVEKETNKKEEMPTIAGVYLNRLRIGMKLQADPTLVFASGDFSIRRVLNQHKEINSRYNTYIHKGLPPGPICMPSIDAIEAVLNSEDHEYLYFCADGEMTGYHKFARTYREHLKNARQYRRALK